ncbi:MAG: guanylate kinase [Provencibacterium sp.]|jgi:guanylate kinase|nr:guanylate kinase [Provencibacterium sp.]
MPVNSQGRLFVISGPSGVGKGTVLARFLKDRPDVRLSVSATTRSPRPGERNGESYFFLGREEFEDKISAGGMLEYAQYNNEYYGTPRAAVESWVREGYDVILEIEVQGAMQVRARWPEAVLVFIMPPDFETLRARLSGRGTEDEQTIRKRLSAAVRELKSAGDYDFVLVNDTVEGAAQALGGILESAKYLVKTNQTFIMEVMKDAEAEPVAN